jgi:hypothetical protein
MLQICNMRLDLFNTRFASEHWSGHSDVGCTSVTSAGGIFHRNDVRRGEVHSCEWCKGRLQFSLTQLFAFVGEFRQIALQ